MVTRAELREHYDIELELAARLRSAPSRAARRRLYEEVYRQRSERIRHHPLVAQARDATARAAAVAPQVALIRPFVGASSVFCEIGAGDGAVARALAPHVRRAIALDVTDALALPDDAPSGFEFRTFDGFTLDVSDEVDVVYSNDVLEHLHAEDAHDHFRAILGALRKGGVHICVTPNRLSGPHDISGQFGDRSPRGFHLREYTTTEIARICHEVGFSSVRILVTVHGRRLLPLAPVAAIRPLEAAIGLLPFQIRRRAGRALAAVKVVAGK